MAVSETTSERMRKAGQRLQAAYDAVRSAESELIAAQRENNDASRLWEREFFADAEKRSERTRTG